MTSLAQERVDTFEGLPVTRAMIAIVAALLRVVDTRANILDSAQEVDHEPETCETCGGTGFILVPSPADDLAVDDTDDMPALSERVGASDDARAGPVPAPTRVPVPDIHAHSAPPVIAITSLAPAPAILATALDTTLASANVQASVPPQASAPPATLAGGALAPPSAAPLPTLSSAAPPPAHSSAAPPASLLSAAPPPALPTAAPSVPLSSAPVTNAQPVATLAVNAPPPINIPPQSVVLAGYHPIGPNVQAPHPTNAVYCAQGADRYYSVTKGIRVGVFAGWQNTSPYVTGVASASYSRHRSIHAAYDAYCSAYYAGFVQYV